MNKRIALFPGSFDPITLGHLDIIERALPLFDEIQIAVGKNTEKKYLFSLEQRVAWIEKTFAHEPKVRVITYEGLTVDFAQKQGVNFLLRGLRNPADFEFEKQLPKRIGKWCLNWRPYFCSRVRDMHILVHIVRDVYIHGGDF